MRKSSPLELRVGVDVGCHSHNVAIGLSNGEILEEFSIKHEPEGFRQFFACIEKHEKKHSLPVSVAMEGYNGYARPLDTLVRARDYRLFNINNLKLARFKEIFPGAAKTDEIDARKALELFQLRDYLPVAKDVLQEVRATPKENEVLKRLSRRRRRLVNERVRVLNNFQADLQSVCPGLLEITGDAGNLWFLRFITSVDSLPKLARMREGTIRKLPGIGAKYTGIIITWQKQAHFSHEVEWVSDMILEDAWRILELHESIDSLDRRMAAVAIDSEIAQNLSTIPGFGSTTIAELAGEIGTVERFKDEQSLALYLGMTNLDNSSGKKKGSKPPKQVNERAKAAMMTAVDRHRKQVPQSQTYYRKKRAEGKKHNQAVRALGRHLCRVIFKMLKENRGYLLPQ
ncbi:transposase, IS116/IS110/IS902 family [Geotalea daltonii FRC-32]|uniref:Transposase, IS116/IS110/IS902 family n=1 Tax=Geotalea daltonii (strain DSM 22248 / JCM 15807 / FRC-32) TaxID=316067 RepID=B9M3P6_GEODF|nr:IS110 family transposase [Geotalea daltonii]ACM21467.1 transposase, IS116/IS110/IS902 family [Geotalea daltonii FRC-32]